MGEAETLADRASRRLPARAILRRRLGMEEQGLSQALYRAEAALDRIERTVAKLGGERGRDEELRARVREAVTELDQLIRSAGA